MKTIHRHENVGNCLEIDRGCMGREGSEIIGDKMRDDDTLVEKLEGVSSLLYTMNRNTRTE